MPSVVRTRLQRRTLGKHFNEGARQTWLAIERKSWTVADLASALGKTQGALHRVLHGDVLPKLEIATGTERLLRVRCALWLIPAKLPFSPPAARAG